MNRDWRSKVFFLINRIDFPIQMSKWMKNYINLITKFQTKNVSTFLKFNVGTKATLTSIKCVFVYCFSKWIKIFFLMLQKSGNKKVLWFLCTWHILCCAYLLSIKALCNSLCMESFLGWWKNWHAVFIAGRWGRMLDVHMKVDFLRASEKAPLNFQKLNIN